MIRSLLLALLITILASPAFAGDTARVLFIGNSLTGVNDLPEQTRLIAASKGDVLIKGYAVVGGALLQNHCSNPQTLALIDSGIWDVVVLQEQSELPAFPDNQVQQDMYPYAKILCDRIRQKSPCAKLMFYMTWGYQNGDANNCGTFPPICTYSGMDSMIRLRYKNVADSNNALICPAGGTTRMLRTLYPGLTLYATDGYHPSPENTYAAACSFYASIFHKSPVGASYLYSLSAFNAANIQNAAKVVAYDSLSYWSQWWMPTIALPQSSFTNATTGKTVQFANTSLNANIYSWSFGDGTASTSTNPSHTYAANGSYNVRLISKSSCGNVDTMKKTIVINATAVNGVNAPNKKPVAFPNPVRGVLSLQNLDGQYLVAGLYDAEGMLVKSFSIPVGAQSFEMSMKEYARGVYGLRLSGKGEAVVLRIVKVD